MHRLFRVAVIVLLLVTFGYGASRPARALVITDRCEMSGSGALPGGDAFEGSVRGDSAGATGTWRHTATDGTVVVGDAAWIFCRLNGVFLGDLGGTATVNGVSGFEFRVHGQDYGSGWVERPVEIQRVSATRRYRPAQWEDGAVTVGERARVVIPAALPVSVGNAGNQWAWLMMERVEPDDLVICRYRGGASLPRPVTAEDRAAGELYEFERCTGELPGTPEVHVGDRVTVGSMTLHVHSGDPLSPSEASAETTVAVDLEVTPLRRVQDHYRIFVWRSADGVRVFERAEDLASGDLRIVEPR